MKKLVLIMVAMFGFLSCENPSMEDGLASLTESLAELEASMLALDVEGMLVDLAEMEAQTLQAIADAEESNAIMEDALVTVGNIKERLAAVQVLLDDAATTEQVAALADSVAEITEGVDLLVFLADYDYDGVMNGLDQCPDTAIEDINNVNSVGCSPTQTPTTGTTTTTTGG